MPNARTLLDASAEGVPAAASAAGDGDRVAVDHDHSVGLFHLDLVAPGSVAADVAALDLEVGALRLDPHCLRGDTAERGESQDVPVAVHEEIFLVIRLVSRLHPLNEPPPRSVWGGSDVAAVDDDLALQEGVVGGLDPTLFVRGGLAVDLAALGVDRGRGGGRGVGLDRGGVRLDLGADVADRRVGRGEINYVVVGAAGEGCDQGEKHQVAHR